MIVGKTNMPEFGILPVSEPRRFGPVRNPWDLERTPGGSSGGAAAAVAAGLVPLAHGSDGGGSIRIPAACCGLVGLKPSRGRVSRGPDQGDDLLVQDGVLTRTVAETAELLDVLAGYEPGDASWAPPPAEPFAASAAREPGRLRIGVTVESPLEAELDPACVQAVHDAAELLAGLGHEVEEVSPPWTGQNLLAVFTLVFGSPIALALKFGSLVSGREPAEELVEPLSWTMWTGIAERSPVDYLLARAAAQRGVARDRAALGRPRRRAHARAGPAPGADRRDRRLLGRALGGLPALGRVHPLHRALQRHRPARRLAAAVRGRRRPAARRCSSPGAPAGEGELLALAAQIEAARPWAERRPPVRELPAAPDRGRS